MQTSAFNTEPFKWPSGDCKAVIQLRLSTDAISEKFGLKFKREKDDLDWGKFSHFIDEVVGPILLIEYENSPISGLDVYVDVGIDNRIAIERIRSVLQIKESDISWSI